ncbi:MAG TPA: signal peptide peptidase SppA [Pirellulales bacterium]
MLSLFTLAPATFAADDKPGADKAADKTSDKATPDKTAEKSTDKPTEKTADKPADKAAEKSTEKKAKVSLAVLDIDASYPEGPGQPGVFGDLKPTLAKMIERLDKAAADDKISGIVLQIDEASIGRGKLDELRSAIARARKSGKKVYACLNEGTSAEYLLASACDEIVMPPVGMISIAGVRMEFMHFKKLFEKLGVHADFLQMGDYKGAAEPFTRENMSPEFKKQMDSVLDDYYAQLVDTIAADRKLDPGKVKDLIDEGLFTSAAAKDAGLIDRVAYVDEFRQQLADQKHVDAVTLVEDYGKKQLDEEDFSGFAGFMKMIQMISGADQGKKTTSAGQKIAVIYAVGEISSGDSKSGLSGEGMGSDTIVKALREAEKDSKVVGIVLRVDSPGGSALASDLMWREITRIKAKKPVVASMGDIAASGGYYISMGCTKIFAEPGTLTGSIGVVTGKFALQGLLDKVGVTVDAISRGKNSGWMSSDEPFTDSEKAVVMRMMKDCYRQFTEKAASGRNMEVKQLESLAGGRLYTGKMAKACKLVDELGTLDDAVADVKRLAGLKEDDKTERLILPEPKSFFESLLGGGPLASNNNAASAAIEELAPQLKRALSAAKLFKEPAVLILPYQVQVK